MRFLSKNGVLDEVTMDFISTWSWVSSFMGYCLAVVRVRRCLHWTRGTITWILLRLLIWIEYHLMISLQTTSLELPCGVSRVVNRVIFVVSVLISLIVLWMSSLLSILYLQISYATLIVSALSCCFQQSWVRNEVETNKFKATDYHKRQNHQISPYLYPPSIVWSRL